MWTFMAASLKNEIRKKLTKIQVRMKSEHKQYGKYLFILYFMHWIINCFKGSTSTDKKFK